MRGESVEGGRERITEEVGSGGKSRGVELEQRKSLRLFFLFAQANLYKVLQLHTFNQKSEMPGNVHFTANISRDSAACFG